MRRATRLALFLTLALTATAGNAEPRVDALMAALRSCEAHFGSAPHLVAAFTAAGWRDEGGAGTPIHVFTLQDRQIIASFTRAGQPKAGCTAAANKFSLKTTVAVAEAFVGQARRLEKHQSEPLTWVWTNRRPAVWLGVTEDRKNFSIFRAYAIAFLER